MKRRGERHDAETAQSGRQLLGSSLHPGRVGDRLVGGCPGRVGQHSGIGIKTDDRVKQPCQPQRDCARSAPDVQQSPVTLEAKTARKNLSQPRCVGQPAPLVIAGSPGK